MKKGLLIGLAVVLLCIMQSPTWGQEASLSQVQQDIKGKGAKWEARETSMSRLSVEERRMRLGHRGSATPGKGRVAVATTPAYALAPNLDWRNNGGNYVSGVRNQGGCGSCWAFAATAALESYTMIKNKQPNTNLDLSEQVTVSCSGGGSCAGGDPSAAANFFMSTGLPLETCYPYTGANGTCASACPNWQPTAYKLKDWNWVTSANGQTPVDAVKSALTDHGPLIMTMHVYGDFMYYGGGVYTHVSGSWAGDHAILTVGYDDANQCFIVKNSWGTGWGESGFFRIAYSEITGDSKFGYWTIAFEGNDPPPPPPTCDYTSSKLFSSAGGTGAVAVTPADGCMWTATSSASWLSITSGASGTGPGTVQYTVQPATGSSARTANITIQDQTFSITQAGTTAVSAAATRR
jgi:C1A family cysteine protease